MFTKTWYLVVRHNGEVAKPVVRMRSDESGAWIDESVDDLTIIEAVTRGLALPTDGDLKIEAKLIVHVHFESVALATCGETDHPDPDSPRWYITRREGLWAIKPVLSRKRARRPQSVPFELWGLTGQPEANIPLH